MIFSVMPSSSWVEISLISMSLNQFSGDERKSSVKRCMASLASAADASLMASFPSMVMTAPLQKRGKSSSESLAYISCESSTFLWLSRRTILEVTVRSK